MSDVVGKQANTTGISPLRKTVSAIVLCVLAIVLIVELRAGMGHMMSGKMLKEKSPEGAFDRLLLDEFEPMLSFAPTRTVVREMGDEVEYKYSWFSLLRPLLSRPEAAYYVVASNATPAMVRRYNTEPPTEKDLAVRVVSEYVEEADGGGPGFDDPDAGGGGFGGGGGGGGRGAFDPAAIFDRRDEDKNDKLTGDELSGRLQDRVAELDKDGDGEITRAEFLEGMQNAPAGGRRGGPSGGSDGSNPATSRVRPEIEEGNTTEDKAPEDPAAAEKTE